MKAFVCVDDNCGMAFLGKRQSRDSRVLDDIISISSGSLVYMTERTKKLFPNTDFAIASEITDQILSSDEYYFFETESPIGYLDSIDEIVMYRWNRRYPSDLKLGFSPNDSEYTRVSVIEFIGTSHDLITKEVYKK